MTFELTGKVAVVTGASSGIGEATARRLAQAGMRVVAVARRGERLEALAARDGRIVAHVADVTDQQAVDGLVERVEEEFGACHVLVNSAGIRGAPLRDRDDLEATLRIIDVNLVGTVRVTASMAGLLRASAPSRVVNIGSVAGKLGVGPPGYAASKFGTVGFTESLSFNWAADGIAVCELNPGFVETEGFPQTRWQGTPLARRIVKPEDIAREVHRTVLSGSPERTVPRWYRIPVVVRHVAAPLYRAAASRIARRRDRG